MKMQQRVKIKSWLMKLLPKDPCIVKDSPNPSYHLREVRNKSKENIPKISKSKFGKKWNALTLDKVYLQ